MVMYIHSCSCRPFQKVHRKILVKQHCFRCSHYGSVLLFCNPILLRIIWSAELPLNSRLSAEFHELFRGELYTVVLWCIIVPYEYTLLPRKIELGPFLLWDMYVHRETKYYQMANFWFLSWESLFRIIIVKYSMTSTVLYIHNCSCCVCPKVHRKVTVKQHCFRCSHYGSVLSFRNPIW